MPPPVLGAPLLLSIVTYLSNIVFISQLLQARHRCADLGGMLAVLSTPTTWDEVTGILFKKQPLAVYIGLASFSPNLPKMYVVFKRSGLLLTDYSRFILLSFPHLFALVSFLTFKGRELTQDIDK